MEYSLHANAVSNQCMIANPCYSCSMNVSDDVIKEEPQEEEEEDEYIDMVCVPEVNTSSESDEKIVHDQCQEVNEITQCNKV